MFVYVCICFLLFPFKFSVATNKPVLIWETDVVDFVWPSSTARSNAINTGAYIPLNNIITGVKWWNNVFYLTVPRWRAGVPSTLNSFNPQGATSSNLLTPWPSFGMNQIGLCSSFQYIQSMEIDTLGRMWIIDVGRVNIFDNSTVPYNVFACPPKLVIIDITSQVVLRSHTFSTDTVPYTTNFINDIVLDQKNGFAYITDTGEGADGGLVIYNYNTDISRRYSSHYTNVDNNATMFRINHRNYTIMDPSDTIALSADAETLYFGALSGYKMYQVSTAILRDYTMTASQITANISIAFIRGYSRTQPTQCDGMTCSSSNMCYYGSHSTPTEDSIVVTNFTGTAQTTVSLYNNETTMQWVDTLAWAGEGLLVFTTNRLQRFFFGPPLVSGQGANFRLFTLMVPGQSSYLCSTYQQPPILIPFPSSCVVPSSTAANSVTISAGALAGIAIVCLVAGLVIGGPLFNYFMLKGSLSNKDNNKA